MKTDIAVARLLEDYFRRRAERLDSANLEQVIAHADPRLLCLHRMGRADEVVGRLLERALEAFDQANVLQLLRRLQTEHPIESDSALVRLVSDYDGEGYVVHGDAWARAINRVTLQFLDEFASPDGSLDWSQLARSVQAAEGREKGRVIDGFGSR